MKKFTLLSLLVFTLILTISTAHAKNLNPSFRRLADSQYRIAKKTYNKAVNDYGESMAGMPDKERESACKKLRSALHDNKTQISREDPLNQSKYRRQTKELEGYNAAMGCPK